MVKDDFNILPCLIKSNILCEWKKMKKARQRNALLRKNDQQLMAYAACCFDLRYLSHIACARRIVRGSRRSRFHVRVCHVVVNISVTVRGQDR